MVAATGNEGNVNGISAPANCNNVIAVTAHAINGENASYSNIDAVGGSQVTNQCGRRRFPRYWFGPGASGLMIRLGWLLHLVHDL